MAMQQEAHLVGENLLQMSQKALFRETRSNLEELS